MTRFASLATTYLCCASERGCIVAIVHNACRGETCVSFAALQRVLEASHFPKGLFPVSFSRSNA